MYIKERNPSHLERQSGSEGRKEGGRGSRASREEDAHFMV